ncbi:MAG TPA: VanZ family protein [Polyangiaceae bacterium]|nr:VanZ family protein [Polyangiaceae bacterium]
MMAALARAWQKPRGVLLDVGPAVAYLLVLFWAGLIPLKSLPGPDFALADKAWHLAAFGGLAGLFARSVAHFGRPSLLAARDAALAATALGGLLEILQGFTAYRSPDWADFLADSLGTALAYGVLRAIHGLAEPSPRAT